MKKGEWMAVGAKKVSALFSIWEIQSIFMCYKMTARKGENKYTEEEGGACKFQFLEDEGRWNVSHKWSDNFCRRNKLTEEIQ